jgi:hypothetical protein
MEDREVHRLIGETDDASGVNAYTEWYEEYDMFVTYNEDGRVTFVGSPTCQSAVNTSQ